MTRRYPDERSPALPCRSRARRVPPGPGRWPRDDEITRELGTATHYCVIAQGRPDAGPLAVWIEFGTQEADGRNRRELGELFARWDHERIAEARATLDGEQAPFATFAAVLFDYLRLPVMAGPVTARHAEIAQHRAMTAALKAPIQSTRRH
jgi:hypothetical protein